MKNFNHPNHEITGRCQRGLGARRDLPGKCRGAIAIFALLMLTFFIVMAAFAVELSMFMAEKAEMQRSADAAAVAACWEYLAHQNKGTPETDARIYAREIGSQSAGVNLVRLRSLDAHLNSENAPEGDIVFGTFSDFGNPYGNVLAHDSGPANAVAVRVRQTDNRNGEVSFRLGRLLGINSKPLEVEAVAAFGTRIRGFYSPEGSKTINLLPFTIKRELWQTLFDGTASDQYTYDFETGTISGGPDGVPEINIYPYDTGAAANSGTIDIGGSGNSNSDIRRQILYGVSKEDLAHHGGTLEFDSNGVLLLNGDTGISSGMKAELKTIKGTPRVMTIFTTVTGDGNNADFTIIQFVGVRIMDINFQGSKNFSKKLIIQPTYTTSDYVIVTNDSTSEPSQFVYSKPVIVK